MKKVVIVGAGFAGINCALKLSKFSKHFEITLLDKNNHHVFQPMLYQAATAFIPLTSVAVPIRKIIDNSKIDFHMDEVVSIDPDKRLVVTKDKKYEYDFLVVATGVEYDYFNNLHWKDNSLSLKTAADAQKMKYHILRQFELAENASSDEERKKYLTFIIIGAGATGVEITGALLDILTTDIFKSYKTFSRDDITVNLIDAGKTILSAFSEKLSNYAYDSLTKRGVKVYLNESVKDISNNKVTANKREYEGATIIWSALLSGSPLGDWMAKEMEKGKISVAPDLRHSKYKNIYFAGDISRCEKKPLPGLASVAKQQGKYIAQHIINTSIHKPCKDFKYKDLGTMAIIQKHSAIAQIFGFKLKGRLGWFIWGGVHITFLISMKNRFVVSFNWLSYYLFKRIEASEIINPEEKNKNPK